MIRPKMIRNAATAAGCAVIAMMTFCLIQAQELPVPKTEMHGQSTPDQEPADREETSPPAPPKEEKAEPAEIRLPELKELPQAHDAQDEEKEPHDQEQRTEIGMKIDAQSSGCWSGEKPGMTLEWTRGNIRVEMNIKTSTPCYYLAEKSAWRKDKKEIHLQLRLKRKEGICIQCTGCYKIKARLEDVKPQEDFLVFASILVGDRKIQEKEVLHLTH